MALTSAIAGYSIRKSPVLTPSLGLVNFVISIPALSQFQDNEAGLPEPITQSPPVLYQAQVFQTKPPDTEEPKGNSREWIFLKGHLVTPETSKVIPEGVPATLTDADQAIQGRFFPVLTTKNPVIQAAKLHLAKGQAIEGWFQVEQQQRST